MVKSPCAVLPEPTVVAGDASSQGVGFGEHLVSTMEDTNLHLRNAMVPLIPAVVTNAVDVGVGNHPDLPVNNVHLDGRVYVPSTATATSTGKSLIPSIVSRNFRAHD